MTDTFAKITHSLRMTQKDWKRSIAQPGVNDGDTLHKM